MLSFRRLFFYFILFAFCVNGSVLLAQNEAERHDTIQGVEVHGGVNPADILMERAYDLRDTNSAFRCASFQYVSYQKLTILPIKLSDSLQRLAEQPLFLSESVSEMRFKQPNKKSEKLVASKTSGLENPIFNLALSSLQTTNIYEKDYISIFEVDYVNPLSRNSTKLYQFRLTDTLRSDTAVLYGISFEPKPGRAFKSLKGSLHLDSATFAVQSIEARPFDENVTFRITIRHTYARQRNGCWFPTQLEASFKLPRIAAKGDTLEAAGTSVITIQDLQLDPVLKNREFGLCDVEESIESKKKEQQLFDAYRVDSLTDKEIRTYQLVDSISQAFKLERKLNLLSSLMRGLIPIGPIDVDLASIVDYTYCEGWRFGLGLYTNKKMLKFARLGGYFAYGLKDKAWKWGVLTEWELNKKYSVLLKIRYFDDIIESGGLSLVSRDELGMLNGEYYRHWIITKFDRSRSVLCRFQMRPDRNFTLSLTGGMRWNTTLFNYHFNRYSHVEEDAPFSYEYQFLRGGIRFSYDEKTIRSSNLTMYTPSKYPTLQIQYEWGRIYHRPADELQFCHKINLRLHHLQRYKILGYSEISIDGGWINAPVPYSLLYVMPAGYEKVGFYGEEQFAVMRPNEFATDAYVAVFFRHNFGKMWEGKFSPRIVICQNIGFGWAHHPELHRGVTVQGMEKGYFESGLMIDNLLSVKDLLAMGVGVFFRYGPYSMENLKDNFALKVSLTVPMAE